MSIKFTQNVGLQSPWQTQRNIIAAVFEEDPAVAVSDVELDDRDNSRRIVHVEVRNHEKFLALQDLLIQHYQYGNVSLEVYLYDIENNTTQEDDDATVEFEKLHKALNGNPILNRCITVRDNLGTPHNYVVFNSDQLQFFNDDLTDYRGYWHGLPADAARSIFAVKNWNNQLCTINKYENELEQQDVIKSAK